MSSSTDVSSCEEDASECAGRNHILQPYMFEPQYSALDIESNSGSPKHSDINERDSDSSGDLTEDVVRVGNTDWCLCGHCSRMETELESMCCKEGGPKIASKMQELLCVTDHPSFEAVVLNSDNLQTVHLRMHDIRADPYQDPPENDTFRWVGYTQFIYWVYKKLGPQRRKMIPSCVKNLIRERYPAPGGIYIGHREAWW